MLSNVFFFLNLSGVADCLPLLISLVLLYLSEHSAVILLLFVHDLRLPLVVVPHLLIQLVFEILHFGQLLSLGSELVSLM